MMVPARQKTGKDFGVVSIVKTNGTDMAKSFGRAIDLIGGLQPSNLPVLIKPNLCVERDPSRRATVSCQVVKALIDEILGLKRDSKIRIVESDSFGKYIDTAFKNFGYVDLQKEYQDRNLDVSIVNLSKEPRTDISLQGLHLHEVKMPRILLEPKFFVSIAKLKTHGLTKITGVLKNQFGCLPEKDKTIYHGHINEVIVDINNIIKPDLCFVDGLVEMEGVVRGKPRRLGVFLAGYNPVCVDSILARVMGFEPTRIRHISLSEKSGLGSIQADVVGEPPSSVSVKFTKPTPSIISQIGKIIPEPLYPVAKRIYEKVIG